MRNLIALAAACGALVFTTTANAHSRINQRQVHQQHRIANGFQNGSLTRHEALRLGRQQGQIARYEAQSRRDGHGLSRYERTRIEAMQDRASRKIYIQKRDWQRR